MYWSFVRCYNGISCCILVRNICVTGSMSKKFKRSDSTEFEDSGEDTVAYLSSDGTSSGKSTKLPKRKALLLQIQVTGIQVMRNLSLSTLFPQKTLTVQLSHQVHHQRKMMSVGSIPKKGRQMPIVKGTVWVGLEVEQNLLHAIFQNLHP